MRCSVEPRWLCTLFAVLLAGCAKSQAPHAGSESHFLSHCERSTECGDGLHCLAQICSVHCESDEVCGELAKDATCGAASASATANTCDLGCTRDRDCDALGEGFECAQDRCREAKSQDETDAEVMPNGDAGPIDDRELVGTSEPLGEPVEVAFKAGYFSDEQIWLRGESGALRQLSTWPFQPDDGASCEQAFSSGGYVGGGRFGELVFDTSGRYLLFTELTQCGSTSPRTMRLIVYDTESGDSRVLKRIAAESLLSVVQGAGITVMVLNHLPPLAGPEPPKWVELFDFEAGALHPIEVQSAASAVPISQDTAVLRWQDGGVLVGSGFAPLRWTGERWEPFELPRELADLESLRIAESPSGERLCALGMRRDGPGAGVTVGAVIDADASVASVELANVTLTWRSRCALTVDEEHVAFDGQIAARNAGAITPVGPEVKDFILAGAVGNAFYGTSNHAVVMLDPSDLQLVEVLASQLGMCGEPEHPSSDLAGPWSAVLMLAPDARRMAVLKQSCGCIDCDMSASVALNLADGTSQLVESVWQGHEVYAVAWPKTGGALVFSTQGEGPGSASDSERMPAAGSYFAIDAKAQVATVDMANEVSGVVHGPATRPSP